MLFGKKKGKIQPQNTIASVPGYVKYSEKLAWALNQYNLTHHNLRVQFVVGDMYNNVTKTWYPRTDLRGIYMIPSDKSLADYGGDTKSEVFQKQASFIGTCDESYYRSMYGLLPDGSAVHDMKSDKDSIMWIAERYWHEYNSSISDGYAVQYPPKERIATDGNRPPVREIPFEDVIKNIDSSYSL